MAYKYVYADVSIIVNDRENCSSPFTYFAMRKFASGIKKPESSILAQCSLPAINYSSRRSLERRRKSRDCGTKTDQNKLSTTCHAVASREGGSAYSFTTSICLSITCPV